MEADKNHQRGNVLKKAIEVRKLKIKQQSEIENFQLDAISVI